MAFSALNNSELTSLPIVLLPPVASLDDKLQFMMQQIVDMRTDNMKFQAEHVQMKTDINQHTTEIKDLQIDVGSCQTQILQLKNRLNHREQKDRQLQIRIFGLQITEEETAAPDGRATAKVAYDRILKPLLTAAKEANLLPTVPQLANVIQDAYRLRSRSGSAPASSPPAILVRLASNNIKSALFRVKKDHMLKPNPAEKTSGVRWFNLSEDLTSANHGALMRLRADTRIARAWTVDGNIRYVLAGSDRVCRLNSPYEHPEL